MSNIEILHKFAESYTTLMGLLVKETNLLHHNTESLLRNLSTNTTNGTQMDIENNNSMILTSEEYENVEKIFMTILQAIDEDYYDKDAILRLADSTKQMLSRFIVAKKKEKPLIIKNLYDKIITNDAISNEMRLLLEILNHQIYEN